ncbi:hypothetical protein vseg_019036 [Gypsophila vaccaria]
MENKKIYVAIGKEAEEREAIMRWVLKEFIGCTICVIYVHVPAKRIPLPSGLELPVRLVRKNELEAFRAQERDNVLQLLDDCSQMCALFKVPYENTYVEKDSVPGGILELIHRLRIQKLVMGAAANCKYWGGMTKPMSEKAENVLQFAPNFCHIWFVCKGHLICQREGGVQGSSAAEETPPNSLEFNNLSNSGILFGGHRSAFKTHRSSTFSESQSLSARTRVSNTLSARVLPVSSFGKEDVTEQHDIEFSAVPERRYQQLGSSSTSQCSTNGNLYNQLERSTSEAERSWREAFRETVSCWKAKKQALEATRKAKPIERLYYEELQLKKMMEEDAENTKKMLDKLSLELSEALDHKSLFESQVEEFNVKVKELEKKLFSETGLSHMYKNERDQLQVEIDRALIETEEIRKKLAEGPCSSVDPMYYEISYLELQKATNYFNPLLKVGEGCCGSMYKGFLHHTEVAIKLLAPNRVQNVREFDEQVGFIGKLRHPNLVTLMGACREPQALVYEYLPGGSLEDRLMYHGYNTPPLPWQIRVRIAMDICSALIFLHSSQLTSIVHADLMPGKLLLDANLTCKITDFSAVTKDKSSKDLITTRLFKTEPYNASLHSDLGSDVCSFGIMVLTLLTGEVATLETTKEVEDALKIGTLDSILDPFAGDWPYVQAEQLARMALRCCLTTKINRPDLASDVWRVLAPMRTSCSGLSLFSLASPDQPPHLFTCPILQEIMEDPHFAADGFTYEAEAIRGWLDSGHNTSPMTNVKLVNHNLTPNHSLRSAIQEWLQSTAKK